MDICFTICFVSLLFLSSLFENFKVIWIYKILLLLFFYTLKIELKHSFIIRFPYIQFESFAILFHNLYNMNENELRISGVYFRLVIWQIKSKEDKNESTVFICVNAIYACVCICVRACPCHIDNITNKKKENKIK